MLRVVQLPSGDAGTMATVELMAELVRVGLTGVAVHEVARELSWHGGDEVGRLRVWLESNVRFTDDAWISRASGLVGVAEFLTEPGLMIRQMHQRGFAVGDCDDVAILGAAIGRAMGYQARFRVLAFGQGWGDPFLHVYTELRDRRIWRDLDTTAPSQDLPPSVTRQFFYAA